MTTVEVETAPPPPAAPLRAKPFLRWVGSKAALLPELLKWTPSRFTTYHEPFLGSGALFFELLQHHSGMRAVLSDANTRLTRTFDAVQNDLDAVLVPLKIYAEMYARYGAAFYTHVRDTVNPDDMTGPEVAAWFIFMSRTGFNGVYRVNASGKYNVPAGSFASPPTICNEALLQTCSLALARATVVNSDFREVERRAVPGDFVYCDPPYIPATATADFTSYTASGFGATDQIALRDMARRLKRRGVRVLLSNSDTAATRELYKDFEIREVARKGAVNSVATKRAKVTELLIR